jgi:hypothetical protein
MSEIMEQNPNQNAPDENKIEEMLSHFKPQPTLRFQNKMNTAPWQRLFSDKTSSSITERKPAHRLIWGLIALVLMTGVLGIASIPPIRAIARQIIFSFIPAPSNQIELQVTPANPGDLFQCSDPANFTLTVKEVQQRAGFIVKEISLLPEGLSYTGSQYDPSYNAVILLYQTDDYKLFLTQRPLGNSQDVFSIGESAIVKIVQFGNIQGEYVVGGWKAISTQPAPGNQTPTNLISINAVWDNDLPQSTLRWQIGDFAYELRSIGEGSPSLSELIILANEIK